MKCEIIYASRTSATRISARKWFPVGVNKNIFFFSNWSTNEGISAASFCHQVAALVPDMFWNFYLVKNNKIANNSAITQAREEISTYLESLEFQKFFDVCLTKFENYQILLNKIRHRFLVTKSYLVGERASLVSLRCVKH